MAAELEEKLEDSSELIKSSGGVFEVEDKGVVIFSKMEAGRFPGDGEVQEVIALVDTGMSVTEARAKAAENVPQPISFFDWLKGLLGGKKAAG